MPKPFHLRKKKKVPSRTQLQVGKKRTGLSRNVSRGISRGTSSTPRFSPSKYRRYCQKRKECYNNHCARCGGVRQETQSHLNQMSLSPAHKNGRYIMNYITRNGDRGKMEIDTFLGRVGAYPGMDTGSEEFSALIRRYQEAHAHLGLVVDGYVNPEYRGGLFDKVLAGETADWKSGASIGVMTQPPPPVLMSEAEVGSGDTSSSVPTSGSGQTSFPPYSSSSVPSTPRPFDPNIFIRPDGRGNPATSTVPGYTPGSPFGSPFSPNVPSGPSQPSPPSGGSTYFPRPDGRGTFTPSTISPSQTPRFSRQPVPNITPTPQTPRIFTQPPATTQPPLTNQPPRNIQRIPIPNTVPPSTYPPPTTYNQPPQPPQTYTPPRQQVQPRNQPSYQPPTPTGPSPEELRRQQQILARQAEAERLQRQRDLQRQQALAQQRQQQQQREAAAARQRELEAAILRQQQGRAGPPKKVTKNETPRQKAMGRDKSNLSGIKTKFDAMMRANPLFKLIPGEYLPLIPKPANMEFVENGSGSYSLKYSLDYSRLPNKGFVKPRGVAISNSLKQIPKSFQKFPNLTASANNPRNSSIVYVEVRNTHASKSIYDQVR